MAGLGAADARAALGRHRAVLGGMADAFRMEAILLIPRAVALAVRPLTEAGLEPVVFKGPAVAARYPEPGLRPMEDIDLLLPRRDHQRALRALGEAGWRVVRAGGGDRYDTALAHDEVPSLFLELHYGLEGTSQRVTALDPGALWARRRPLACAGTPAFGLPLADELVVLAAHAGKPHHGFVRLMWIADLAMIVADAAERGDPVDWDRVRAVARDARCVTVVAAALALARRAGVEAPADLFPLPTPGLAGRGDGAPAVGHLAAGPPGAARLPPQLRAHRRPRPAPQDPAGAPRLGARDRHGASAAWPACRCRALAAAAAKARERRPAARRAARRHR